MKVIRMLIFRFIELLSNCRQAKDALKQVLKNEFIRDDQRALEKHNAAIDITKANNDLAEFILANRERIQIIEDKS